MMKQLAFAVAFLALSGPSTAAARTGNQLHELLASPPDSANQSIASTYIAGVLETGAFYRWVLADTSPQSLSVRLCLPEGATQKQAVDTVTKYLGENPEGAQSASCHVDIHCARESLEMYCNTNPERRSFRTGKSTVIVGTLTFTVAEQAMNVRRKCLIRWGG